jgi:acetyltransferase-like isoleucine patch superfamily enzyme
MSKSIVVIGDGQLASMLCSFPGVLGYVKPGNMDLIYNIKGDKIEDLDPEKHIGVLGIANPVFKKESTIKWEGLGYDLGVLIHPASSILGNPQIGVGSVIFPFVFIDNESVIGKSAYIGGHTAVHKSKVEDYAHLTFGCQLIMSTVEEGAVLGSNTTVLDCRTVGSYSVVGAGSVVHKNVPSNHKLIQEVTEKLVPIEKMEWSEKHFRKKAEVT